MTTIAIIVAAGRGTRLGSDKNNSTTEDYSPPKQYLDLNGLPILYHALLPFYKSKEITFIQSVINPEWQSLYQKCVEQLVETDRTNADKILPFCSGGDSRQISVFNGLKSIDKLAPKNVLIHDGARPFVTEKLIENLTSSLELYDVVIPAHRLVDTIKQCEGDRISETLDRTSLWAAQTPQAFHYELIRNESEKALQSGDDTFTDDASIIEWAGHNVHIIENTTCNMKITTQDDLEQARRRMTKEYSPAIRFGHGYDVHQFEPGKELILCGHPIAFDQKLKGHSDADVGLHALTDAIYGALGDGDIGTHFPPSDPQWKGKKSRHFLEHAKQNAAMKGWSIGNVDVTLICEVPKIRPHRQQMETIIAGILEVSTDEVSVKATTSEGLGFTGRKEGIAAFATATLVKVEIE